MRRRRLSRRLSFSPRMWRCFLLLSKETFDASIFSTYVEVFPQKCKQEYHDDDFLHVCGGVSVSGSYKVSALPFSPRMWRCFQIAWQREAMQNIFSTYVEVFLCSHRLIGGT